MIRTIIIPQYWKILKLLFNNQNAPLHLRDISRKIKLKESATSRHLNMLEKSKVLISKKDANLKKYWLRKQILPEIFQLFAEEKLEELPLIRKNAIKEYVKEQEKKPLIIIIFGSTAKGNYSDDSDIDVLQISANQSDTKKAKEHAEAISGIKIQIFNITEKQFYTELKSKKDKVVQAAISTGFPVFNNKFFYEMINNE